MPVATAQSSDLLSRVNGQIIEEAGLVSDDLLTRLFRALFRVERATEFAEPQLFSLDDDPSLIMDKRMSAAHWRHLPLYIANDEILAKRFEQFTEYTFIFVADLTPSMGYRWRDVYLDAPGASDNAEFLPPGPAFFHQDYSSTKLFQLKYLLYAFLMAGLHSGFKCKAMFFSLNGVTTLPGATPDLASHALRYVDEHFLDDTDPNRWEATEPCPRPLEHVLLHLMEVREESVIVFASDFMDLVHGSLHDADVDPYLAELKYRHRIAVMQINDPHEVNPIDNRDDLPTSTRWAFPRDVEQPTEGGIGQQRFYRPAARNAAFVKSCRSVLGRGDRLEGRVADMTAARGLTLQKFVHGRAPNGANLIDEKLQEIGTWLEE